MGEPAEQKDRDAARLALGARQDASVDEVLNAYSNRSRVLKHQIIRAQDVEERDRVRRLLSDLVGIRDRALGEAEASGYRLQRSSAVRFLREDGWSPEDGIPAGADDRKGGLAFFGIDPSDATPARVRQVYRARAGAIKESIAHAGDNDELRRLQAMLSRLQRVLFILLESWDFDALGTGDSKLPVSGSWTGDSTRTDPRARAPSRGKRGEALGFAWRADSNAPRPQRADPASPGDAPDDGFDAEETIADA